MEDKRDGKSSLHYRFPLLWCTTMYSTNFIGSLVASTRYCRVQKLPSSLSWGTRVGTQGYWFFGEESRESWHRWTNWRWQIELNTRFVQNHRSGRRQNRHRRRGYLWDWIAFVAFPLDNHPSRSRALQRFITNEYRSLQPLWRWRNLDSFRTVPLETLREGKKLKILIKNFFLIIHYFIKC